MLLFILKELLTISFRNLSQFLIRILFSSHRISWNQVRAFYSYETSRLNFIFALRFLSKSCQLMLLVDLQVICHFSSLSNLLFRILCHILWVSSPKCSPQFILVCFLHGLGLMMGEFSLSRTIAAKSGSLYAIIQPFCHGSFTALKSRAHSLISLTCDLDQ